MVDAHGGPTLGWISTEGVDYTQNRSDSAVSLGGTAGISTAWWLSRRAAFWIDLRGFYFPGRDSIYGSARGSGARTRRPSRAGAESPASAWPWGEPRFPGKVPMTPGGKPGVVSAPRLPDQPPDAPAVGAGGGDSAGRLPCSAAVVRGRLPRARQDGLPLGQPPARPGWGLRGRGAGGVHRRPEEAATVRRPRRNRDLALRDHRARRPGLAAAPALVVVGHRARAEPEPRPPAAAALPSGEVAPDPVARLEVRERLLPCIGSWTGLAKSTARPSSCSSWRVSPANASPRSRGHGRHGLGSAHPRAARLHRTDAPARGKEKNGHEGTFIGRRRDSALARSAGGRRVGRRPRRGAGARRPRARRLPRRARRSAPVGYRGTTRRRNVVRGLPSGCGPRW